jgi:hypothetical protein
MSCRGKKTEEEHLEDTTNWRGACLLSSQHKSGNTDVMVVVTGIAKKLMRKDGEENSVHFGVFGRALPH